MVDLEILLEQEKELQFGTFSSESAWEIGQLLVNKGKQLKQPITIDITRNRHQLFHFSFDGTSPDNDEWVRRKTNTVYRFGHSSFYMGRRLESMNKTIEEKYLVAEAEYAAHGGGFPVILKGTGVIGTITVSGLAQEEDHELVVDVLREYLKQN
ncbi:MAG: heme-degrading domain-containing protein [Bacteroidetes bacterium]|nr:heme-degrading domain-containing protein [Bacteroidota bacterium]MDA1120380.1 heme-degrading domain-containing protein [Bacteroidota bacterium]